MARQPRHNKDENKGANGGNGVQPAEPHNPPDALQTRILSALKDKVRQMFEEAAEDPNSQASEMVHLLLLNQLTNMESQLSEKELRAVFGEEHRQQSFKVRLGLSTTRQAHMKKMGEERLKLLRQKLKIEKQKAGDAHNKVLEAERLAKEAKAAADGGQPMDSMAIYNRIAEIVGLRTPMQPIGPQSEPKAVNDSE
ncbi:MAG TPA: hypothetical protein VG860_15825 [Terriglobia bacterium]|jgi:hypothetical protein|nr:hypothetical protein [Terriglobia bacterium]